MKDPVSDTLFLPLIEELIDLPEQGQILFLRARLSDALMDMPREKFVCDQSFKPAHDILERAGFALNDGDGETYPLTLVLPPRQREEYRALLARALLSTHDGGIVMAAVSNNEGAKTVENDLKALAGHVSSLSKNKCRVFWARLDDRRDAELIADWAQFDAPRAIENGRFTSRPGLFAWDHLDAGSKLLVDNMPTNLKGKVADLGAGFGYLSDEVLTKNLAITHVDVIEAEKRALDMARQNLAAHGDRVSFHWADATKPLPDLYDAIITNPPFHITDRSDRHDVGKAFITSAAKALNSGGQLWLVANRHLPYEETLKVAFKSVNAIAENGYFKVFRAVGPKGKTKTYAGSDDQ
ncbi:Ribosomal RNA small subunit methyltransferase C [Asticcacaulis sp. MM231]|uniref:class I SAM-dependent methyltransferase n=1 Tax=Asticcacaulis sp. MM231 TaxID=3157666 RepID=UPI0032D57818